MVDSNSPPYPAEPAEGLVTRLAGRIKGATGWMRFLGALYVIGGSLGVLALILGLLFGAILEQFEGQLPEQLTGDFTGFFIGYLILGLVFAALYIWLGVVLWQAADGIRDAHRHGALAELETGLGRVRVFFVVVGVLTLCGLVLGLVGIVLSLAVMPTITTNV